MGVRGVCRCACERGVEQAVAPRRAGDVGLLAAVTTSPAPSAFLAPSGRWLCIASRAFTPPSPPSPYPCRHRLPPLPPPPGGPSRRRWSLPSGHRPTADAYLDAHATASGSWGRREDADGAGGAPRHALPRPPGLLFVPASGPTTRQWRHSRCQGTWGTGGSVRRSPTTAATAPAPRVDGDPPATACPRRTPWSPRLLPPPRAPASFSGGWRGLGGVW